MTIIATLATRLLAMIAIVVGLGLGATPAHATRLPIDVHRERVVVHAEVGLERMATQFADRAARDLARIAEDLPGLPTPAVVEIRLVNDTRSLASVAPSGRSVPTWAVGVAFPGTSILAVAANRNGTPLDAARTLSHELAHLALDAALGDHAPHWLHEGFAYQHSADFSSERTETLFGMAWMGSVIPLHDLDASFPAEELPAHRAYAESYDFVGFLATRGRWADADDNGDRWPFRRFLRAMAGTDGRPPVDVDTAARSAFGADLEQLFLEWRADLRQRYMFLPAGVFAAILWLLAAVLLVLAWRRRRTQNRVRLARWATDEAAAEARARAWEAWAAQHRAAVEARADADADADRDPTPPHLN